MNLLSHRQPRRLVPYLILVLVVFVILAVIESQLDSGFIRFTGGDVLVVVLVYATLMSVTRLKSTIVALASLGIAYMIELGQALDLVDRTGLEPNRMTDIVLGNTFTWSDIAAYTVGAGLSWAIGLVIER